MRKIRKDDEVIVIAGRDKGRRSSVTRIVNDRAIVSGVNMVKRHVRPQPQMNEPGGIKEVEAPIAISNIALLNPETDKADRVTIRVVDGKRSRYFKSSNTPVDD